MNSKEKGKGKCALCEASGFGLLNWPKNLEVAIRWAILFDRYDELAGKLANEGTRRALLACPSHFLPSDFRIINGRRRRRPDAVPIVEPLAQMAEKAPPAPVDQQRESTAPDQTAEDSDRSEKWLTDDLDKTDPENADVDIETIDDEIPPGLAVAQPAGLRGPTCAGPSNEPHFSGDHYRILEEARGEHINIDEPPVGPVNGGEESAKDLQPELESIAQSTRAGDRPCCSKTSQEMTLTSSDPEEEYIDVMGI